MDSLQAGGILSLRSIIDIVVDSCLLINFILGLHEEGQLRLNLLVYFLHILLKVPLLKQRKTLILMLNSKVIKQYLGIDFHDYLNLIEILLLEKFFY